MAHVVEVLHPAVGHTQGDHGFELLGNNRFAWIDEHARRGVVEHGRIGLTGSWRHDHIAKANVHLNRNARLRKSCLESNPNAVVFVGDADFLPADRVRVKRDPIVHVDRAEIPQDHDDVGHAARPVAKKIEIPRGAPAVVGP